MSDSTITDPATLFAVVLDNKRLELFTRISKAQEFAESINDSRASNLLDARVVRLKATLSDPDKEVTPAENDDGRDYRVALVNEYGHAIACGTPLSFGEAVDLTAHCRVVIIAPNHESAPELASVEGGAA